MAFRTYLSASSVQVCTRMLCESPLFSAGDKKEGIAVVCVPSNIINNRQLNASYLEPQHRVRTHTPGVYVYT